MNDIIALSWTEALSLVGVASAAAGFAASYFKMTTMNAVHRVLDEYVSLRELELRLTALRAELKHHKSSRDDG